MTPMRTRSPSATTTRRCRRSGPAGGQFTYQNGIVAEVIDREHQFTIYIYKGWKPGVVTDNTCGAFNCWNQTAPMAFSTIDYVWMDQMKHPDFKERFEFTVYAPGAR